MENLKFVKDGVSVSLPTGFKFEPSDEELILHYLHNKVMSRPLPDDNIIPDFEVWKSDPWDMPGDSEKYRHFFSMAYNESVNPNGDIPNSYGYWRPTGFDIPITVTKGFEFIFAMKKILSFYRGNSPNGTQTDWIMHEYRLPASPAAAAAAAHVSAVNPFKKIKLSESSDEAAASMDKYWVLIKIFRKKNERKKEVKKVVKMPFISGRNSAPASSSNKP
ncbi:NAC domain-containing protein 83-like [Impatiens glandulifera]|uniref:NAC domain-containing protein 83-like n=1 Tax=Impatiens glandulifera TaxID=253017 RepID=UPI001FB17010|nr:NAC domain-containing protein 83-like [Impatiens glandulifera]